MSLPAAAPKPTAATATAPDAAARVEPAAPGRSHTSVVYVHGMGSQQRLKDTSALVQSLETHAREAGLGELRDIDVRLEESRIDPDSNITYLKATYEGGQVPDGAARGPTRFYEVYWAPIAAGATKRWQVAQWMFQQVPKPVAARGTPWRLRARLRRANLVSLRESLAPGDPARAFVEPLFALYDRFDTPDARRAYPGGTFDDFRAFIAASTPEPAARAGLEALAGRWYRHYLASERTNLVFLLTLALAVVVAVALVVIAVVQGVHIAATNDPSSPSAGDFFAFARREWATIALILGAIVAAGGVASFLEDYLGDVQLWTTYEETNSRYQKRQQIMDAATHVLRHVVSDPNCDRVVVVSHSLGTPIALDAVLRVARDNRALPLSEARAARRQLRKISHFITYGSPIDKVHYLFESRGDPGYRFNRTIEELRGDIGTEPFANVKGERLAHWVNFWDPADIISGSLETPVNRSHPLLAVENVEVRNPGTPATWVAHSSYIDNRAVRGAVFEAVFLRGGGGPDDPPFGGATHAALPRRLALAAAAMLWGFATVFWIPWIFWDQWPLVLAATVGALAAVVLTAKGAPWLLRFARTLVAGG